MEKIIGIFILCSIVYLGSNVVFSLAGFPSESMHFLGRTVPSVGTMSAVCTGIFLIVTGVYLCCKCCKYKKK